MNLTQSLLTIALLIGCSAFFSMAEISLAASRRLRLRQMVDDGDPRAERVMKVQEQPGEYFTVVQVGQNAVAILGGIVGEGALSPFVAGIAKHWLAPSTAQTQKPALGRWRASSAPAAAVARGSNPVITAAWVAET